MLNALSESLGDTMRDTMLKAKQNEPVKEEKLNLSQDELAMLFLYRNGKIHQMKKRNKRKKK